MAEDTARPVILIAGPTASGKSAHAVQLAVQRNGVIINADSLQIYEALPILTAQPGADDRARVPHSLYGVLPPDAVSSVADWIARAVPIIRAAWDAGQTPIVAGGTGLYLKSLRHGLSPLPPVDPQAREAARTLQAALGNPAFHAELARIDPVMAARLRPSDTQRLIRAYEVMVATGKSLAEWQKAAPIAPLPDAAFHSILIDGARDVLRMRARKRLRQMVDMGVVDEVAAFQARIRAGTFDASVPPTQALGFHAFSDAAAGIIAVEAAIEDAVIETGQYIKRQQTWFRHQMSFDETIDISA